MFNTDRNQVRTFFFQVWDKMQQRAPLEPMEALVAEVIDLHPEYHAYLSDRDSHLGRDFLPGEGKTNPFLHMGMHIALKEQLATDRPPGVARQYQRLVAKYGDPHDAEHQMIECLAESLWQAQSNHAMPDEQQYLDCLRRLD